MSASPSLRLLDNSFLILDLDGVYGVAFVGGLAVPALLLAGVAGAYASPEGEAHKPRRSAIIGHVETVRRRHGAPLLLQTE